MPESRRPDFLLHQKSHLASKLLDVVVLAENMPQHGLYRGQVGTVVEILAPNVFEAEFIDNEGQTYAMQALHADSLIVLQYQLMKAA